MSGDIHVVPHKGGWAIAIEGTGLRAPYDTREDAMSVAAEMARVAQVDLIIYSQDGKVSEHRMRGYAH
nr:DUF2188 domain-containing protein [uncultured Cupriavidus sp.]